MWLQQQRSLESNIWQICLTRRNNKLCQRFQSEATFPQLSLRQPLFSSSIKLSTFFCSLFSRQLLSFVCRSSWKWTRPLCPADSVVGRASGASGVRRSASRLCERPNVTGHTCPGIIHHIKRLLSQKAGSNVFPPHLPLFLSPAPPPT